MSFQYRPAILSAATALVLSTTLPASALDGAGFIQLYNGQAGEAGISIEAGAIEDTSENAFILRDVRMTAPQLKAPAQIKEISASGVTIEGKTGFSAAEMSMKGFSLVYTDDEGRENVVTMDGARITGVYYPDPDDLEAPLYTFDETKVEASNLSYSLNGTPVIDLVKLDGFSRKEGERYVTDATVDQITFHADNIKDPQARARVDALGLTKLFFAVRLAGVWDLQTGRMDLSEYSLSADNIGKLAMKLVIDGYTEAWAKSFRALGARQRQVANAGPEAQQEAGKEMLAALSQLKIVNGSIRFDDASITEKVLQMQAQQMGTDASEMATILPAMAAASLQALDNPELVATITGALSTFLQQPGNLSISIAPAEPASFSDLFGLAVLSPQQLAEKLGVTINANK